MAAAEMVNQAPTDPTARVDGIGRVVFAGSLGTVIEWYDFLIYGTAAALCLNKLFFPSISPLNGTLAALASYAVGFVARPFGAALFGHFGDRMGRKSMLMMTMLIMGVGTFLIGLLPSYAEIGVWAPISLVVLRIVQGIGLGGEWGGASVMVLEHAPLARRGFYGSLVQVGFPMGIVLSQAAFALALHLSGEGFLVWGWRLPFLMSIVLVGFGILMRSRISESPIFAAAKARDALLSNPLLHMLTHHPRPFLVAVGLKLSEVSWVYLLTVFVVVYATSSLAMPRTTVLNAITIAALIELITIPLFGLACDAIGRRPLYFAGALFTIVAAFPLFWLLDMRDPVTLTLTIVMALSLGHGLMFAPESSYFPELFGTNVRYSGATLGFQVSAALGGGFAPIIATAIVGMLGGTIGVSIMLVMLGIITLAAAIFAHETRGQPLKP
jgi:MHS family shikimate/dehydroshikimate transporter-like MFS transporter